MSFYIMTRGVKNRFHVVEVIEPVDVKLVQGEMALRVNVIGFKQSMEAAKLMIAEQMMEKEKR